MVSLLHASGRSSFRPGLQRCLVLTGGEGREKNGRAHGKKGRSSIGCVPFFICALFIFRPTLERSDGRGL